MPFVQDTGWARADVIRRKNEYILSLWMQKIYITSVLHSISCHPDLPSVKFKASRHQADKVYRRCFERASALKWSCKSIFFPPHNTSYKWSTYAKHVLCYFFFFLQIHVAEHPWLNHSLQELNWKCTNLGPSYNFIALDMIPLTCTTTEPPASKTL